MIIARSPLRITLGGGGTDLPSYYMEHGGFVLAAAIDKYVYVTVNESFRKKITLKYSHIEDVDTVDEVKHPIIREALRLLKIPGSVDIDTIADIPYGTGMGSSGSFTTALLMALHQFKRETVTKRELAEEAFHIEHDILGQHCGKQDQYIAAIGGVTGFSFERERISYTELPLSPETLANLEDGLLLFFTGYSRSASAILAEQDAGTKEMADSLNVVKQGGNEVYSALLGDDLARFAWCMNEHWSRKRTRTQGMTNDTIDELYLRGMTQGALGGKLVGAGGGGFLMFYTEDKPRLRKAMRPLREVRFKFDFGGTSVLVQA
jgi:D-glycero-alpha-D-manno-heptose-7-phosphate kinase